MRTIIKILLLLTFVGLIHSFLSCKVGRSKYVERYVLRSSSIENEQEVGESIKYFMINANLNEIKEALCHNCERLSYLEQDLIKKLNAIPILDYPVTYWDSSCSAGVLDIKSGNNSIPKKDSIVFTKIFAQLENENFYSFQVINGDYQDFKIGLAKVDKPNFCKILWSHYFADSTVVLQKGFKLRTR